MIKFFRKIRQRLLTENKFSRYLIYAIGEIILVVIGILIALQINNWNEANKEKAYEIKILHEIRKDLILDTIYFNAINDRPKRARNAGDKLREMVINNVIKEDSIPYLVETIGTNFNFTYHNGAYESLKSVGLDKISNDSLRNSISDLYGFSFPRTKELIDPYNERSQEAYGEILELFFEYDIYFKIGSRPKLVSKMDIENIIDHPKFKNAIYLTGGSNRNSAFRIESITNTITKLLKQIDKELKIEDVLKDIPTKDWY